MAVKDVKIYTGAAEGWVSIGDLSKASLPIASSEGNCRIEVSDGNADSADNRMYFTNTVEASVDGVPPAGEQGLVICPTYTGNAWSDGSLRTDERLSLAEFYGKLELKGELGSKQWRDNLDVWCNRISGFDSSRDGVAWINFVSAEELEKGHRPGWDDGTSTAFDEMDQRIQFCVGENGRPIWVGLELGGKGSDLRNIPPYVLLNNAVETRDANGEYDTKASTYWSECPPTQVVSKGYVDNFFDNFVSEFRLCDLQDVATYCREFSRRIPEDRILYRKHPAEDDNPDGMVYDKDDYWQHGWVGSLYLGYPSSYAPGDEPEPDDSAGEDGEGYFYRDWGVGTVGWEIQSLRNMINELGTPSLPELPPGADAGEQYETYKFSEQGSNANYWSTPFTAIDGVFTNGDEWSTDGLQFFRTTQRASIQATAYKLTRCAESGTLYLDNYGRHFSYDLKGWFAVEREPDIGTYYGMKTNVFLFNKKVYTFTRRTTGFQEVYLYRFNSFSQQWEYTGANAEDTTDAERNLLASVENIFTDGSNGFTSSSSLVSSYNDSVLQDTLCHLVNPVTGAAWYFKEDGVAIELTEAQCPRNGLQCFIREKCNDTVYVYAVYENGMSVSTDGINFGPINLYPQASDYMLPQCDGVRWHTCGPAGQPVVLYGEQSGQTITWTLVSQTTPGDRVAATNGRVMISGDYGEDEYLLSGSVDGVYTNKVLLITNSGEIRSLQSPRLTIDHAETQEDANNIFVDRFINAGNLQLGSPDSSDWDAGTIGEALGSAGGATAGFTESVGVDTTDCDIGPADSTGSLTPDGPEVDGVQPYKLELTLPRPPVVTVSAVEPAGACDGDFWIDESEGSGG